MAPRRTHAFVPRRWSLLLAAGICAVLAAVLRSNASGTSGSASARGAITTERPAAFRTALIHRLRDQRLNYHWVVCVPTPHRYESVRVVRCNVDFGEPHIQAYCSVLRGGRLLTNADNPAIPCGHDNSGYSTSVVEYH